LAHVGIATRSLESLSRLYQDLGLEVKTTETVPDQKVRAAILPVGDTAVELLEGTEPDSVISRFVEKRGEGIHHLAFEVDDLRADLRRLKERNVDLIDEVPRIGAGGHLIAFIHPRSTGGVLVELTQAPVHSKE
jgi:methylmalonyl-CoA/ethylmalonyl-CoA epimerase